MAWLRTLEIQERTHETDAHPPQTDAVRQRRCRRVCRRRSVRVGSDRDNHGNHDLDGGRRRFDDQVRGAQRFVSAADGPGSLPAAKGAHGQVPAIRNTGAVGQRGAVHVRPQHAVPVTRFASRRVLPAPFGNFCRRQEMQRRVLAGITMLAALATAIPHAVEAQGRRWGEGYFPNLPVVTQEGKTLHFYDDLLKGKIVVINFIYTSCQDICPVATARLAQVEDKLGEKVGRDIFFISMTVDPERDTPERLNAYAKAFSAGPGWTFVTGKPEDIRAINYKLGERSTSLSEHRNEIVLGNEPTGQWQRDNVFNDLDRVAITIQGLNPKYSD